MPIFRPATTEPGFSTRAELAAHYEKVSGRDISNLDYFVALGYWKLAIILEGVLARFQKGQYGKDTGDDSFPKGVEALANSAADAVERIQGPRLISEGRSQLFSRFLLQGSPIGDNQQGDSNGTDEQQDETTHRRLCGDPRRGRAFIRCGHRYRRFGRRGDRHDRNLGHHR